MAKTIDNVARELYLAMPGAATPPRDERGPLWGEVESTPEYAFCETIARLHVALLSRLERVEVGVVDLEEARP